MLVLGRKTNQKILIGDDIELVVLRISRNFVSLGFEAPRDVKILRKEIVEEQKEESQK